MYYERDLYALNSGKRKKAYRYSFRLGGVESGLYVAYGYSSNSVVDAYRKAMAPSPRFELGIFSSAG